MSKYDLSAVPVVARECVFNLASVDDVDAVNRLALTTGSSSVPSHKRALGYRHVAEKLALAGLTPLPSIEVRPPRLAECRVRLETRRSSGV